MKRKNIVLIGMPGSGKSTLGVILAKDLGMIFIDTDILIQQEEQDTLQNIINRNGGQAVLDIEERMILRLQGENMVVSTGGSAVYSKKAVQHLKKNGTFIYLKLPFEEIEKRITKLDTRGIIFGDARDLRELYDFRANLYDSCADITIDCMGKTAEEIVNEMISRIK